MLALLTALGVAENGDGGGGCAPGDGICEAGNAREGGDTAAKARFQYLSQKVAKASARGKKASSDPDGALGAAGKGDGGGSCAAGDGICEAANARFQYLSREAAAKASARGEKAPSDPDGAENSMAQNSEPLGTAGSRTILPEAGIE